MSIRNYVLTFLTFCSCGAQSQSPVFWDIEFNCDNQSIIFNAQIEEDWHLYAVYVPSPNEGPLPTEFHFKTNKKFKLKDSIFQKKPIMSYDKNFGVDLAYYEKSARFTQPIVTLNSKLKISGNIKYMTCNDNTCIPFDYPFEVKTKCPN